MKKSIRNFFAPIVLSLLVLNTSLTTIGASTITSDKAKAAAFNSLIQLHKTNIQKITLAYAEVSAVGDTLFYVFNLNNNYGFIIIAGDDAAHPLIGYSFKGPYTIPASHIGLSKLLTKRKNELLQIKASNLAATPQIQQEWSVNYAQSKLAFSSDSVSPLVQTTWDQSPYYNALCPGNSVTGCVATAMAQIMRYWQYPAYGMGASSYCDCTPNYSENYGTLSANYKTKLNWSNMPLSISAANNDIATLMYECGVSVQMDYDPSGSGAWVITGDDTVCAQTSYIKYFGYNPATIQGLYRQNYSDAAWTSLIENELLNGRPVQYVGDDTTYGGHTWVCDGFDALNNLHMNWGWSGSDDGYFALNALNPGTPGSQYHFNFYEEALIGIEPLPHQLAAGVYAVVSPNVLTCNNTISPTFELVNIGNSTLTSCNINYQFDQGTINVQPWSGNLLPGQSVNTTVPSINLNEGAHTLIAFTSLPNDSMGANSPFNSDTSNFIIQTVGASIPLSQSFEGLSSLPNGWRTSSDSASIVEWQLVNTVGQSSATCVGFNNCDGDGYTNMTGSTGSLYTEGYNLTNGPASLSFGVAYAECTLSGTYYADTLQVLVSVDCGATWTPIYYKGGATLATAPTFNANTDTSNGGCFKPTASQWRTESINLDNYIGNANVMLQFKNISGWGEWVFVDNININLATSIVNPSASHTIQLFPNPANDKLTIQSPQEITQIKLINSLGQIVYQSPAIQSFSQQLNTSNLAPGYYTVEIQQGPEQARIKMVKQ